MKNIIVIVLVIIICTTKLKELGEGINNINIKRQLYYFNPNVSNIIEGSHFKCDF